MKLTLFQSVKIDPLDTPGGFLYATLRMFKRYCLLMATKTAPRSTTRRTRKSAPKVTTTKVKSPAVVDTKQELVRPNVELISLKSYREDINNRWQIHRYEMQELGKDLRKVYNFAKKSADEFVTFAQPKYDAFVKRIQQA